MTRKLFSGYVAILAVVLLLVPAIGSAQSFDTLRIATYNILNYPGSTSAVRNPEFRKVIHTLSPDVLVVQELVSAAGQNEFLSSVLNAYTPNLYAAAPFNDGPDTDNGLFYKPARCEFLGATYLSTPLRDIAEYVVRPVNSTTSLRIYSVHLKASTGTTNEQARLQEVTILRNRLDSLPSGTPFLILGDFNIYSSAEPAFQLLTSTGTNAAGQAFDPLNLSGSWGSNPAFAPYHTQSPRVRSFGGGSTGGMDDRFDMILTSSTMAGRIVPSSYIAYGNDGNHYNDSINRLPNAAVPDSVANALHAASDHIPVAAKFVFERNVVPIQLAYFNGSLNARADSIVLRWGTVSETNNFGFYVQKRTSTIEQWWTIEHSFVPGHGTTLEPQHYRFAEPNIPPAATLFYRLQQLDLDGTAHFTEGIAVNTVSSVSITQPTTAFLSQNYPNPSNAQTVIEFRVASSDAVSLTVFDMLGREVRRLFDGDAAAGTTYRVKFDASDLAGGVYFYRFVSAQHGSATRRLVYLK
ncbi:MAG: hypothetical protein C4326_10440 [Ignavibacteria bacterium]